MSAIGQAEAVGAATPPAPAGGLPRRAQPYFALVVGGAVASAVAVLRDAAPTGNDWKAFLLLAAGAATMHAFVVHTPRNQVFHMGLVFTVAAAILLPAELVVLLCVLQHLSDWAKERYSWYIQTFNIANYTLAALAAAACSRGVGLALASYDDRPRLAAIGLAGALAFVLVNHVLLVPMLMLARRHSVRQSGLFSFDSVSVDVVLAALGAGVAILTQIDPWALPFALAPLLLIHRALAVPQLQAEARIDSKTGLFNSRHFDAELRAEVARAGRFGRPLSVLMADLDLLRAINNRYGHLAGDTVLRGIADVLRTEVRDYDTACRFGGEEFAVILPETHPERALEIAERICSAVAAAEFAQETREHPQLRATVSIGVASLPRDATTAEGLLRAADAALYRAKRDGRNRVAA